MEDKLQDLLSYAEQFETAENNVNEREAENGIEFMPEFFQQVKQIRSFIRSIENDTSALRDNYEERLGKITSADKKRLGEESEVLVNGINKTSQRVKNEIEELTKNNPNITVQQAQDLAAEERIKKNVHVTLVQEFIRAMEGYQLVHAQFKRRHAKNVKRQVLIVNPNATSEEIEHVIQSGDAEQIFADSVQRDKSARAALKYIRDRHQDLLQIEKSLQQVQALFVDMALLVAEQRAMVDSLEHNIGRAMGSVVQGKAQLRKANKLQRKCVIS